MKFARLLTIILLVQPLAIWAIDLQPNDIVAPLPGKSHAMISYVNTDNSTYYRNGTVLTTALPKSASLKSPDISTQTGILRVSTSYALSELPAISYLQLP